MQPLAIDTSSYVQPRESRLYIPKQDFGVIESRGKFDPDGYREVLEGRAAIYVARGAMNSEHCKNIQARANASPHRIQYKVKPSIWTIGPKGGGSLFTLKDLGQYLDLAPETQKVTFDIFEGGPNYLADTVARIRESFESRGVVYRAPRFGDKTAFYSIVRGWGEEGSDADGFAARIHEDQDQIRNPLQAGFEVQQTCSNPQGSINCCYASSTKGGELMVYNVRPSTADFQSEDAGKYGYGFSEEQMKAMYAENGQEMIVAQMRPETGDMYVLRSDVLHAVKAPAGKGQRITAATLGGIKSETPEEQNAFAQYYPDLANKYAQLAEVHDRVETILYWS